MRAARVANAGKVKGVPGFQEMSEMLCKAPPKRPLSTLKALSGTHITAGSVGHVAKAFLGQWDARGDDGEAEGIAVSALGYSTLTRNEPPDFGNSWNAVPQLDAACCSHCINVSPCKVRSCSKADFMFACAACHSGQQANAAEDLMMLGSGVHAYRNSFVEKRPPPPPLRTE